LLPQGADFSCEKMTSLLLESAKLIGLSLVQRLLFSLVTRELPLVVLIFNNLSVSLCNGTHGFDFQLVRL
tara:strand:+ start:51 stop:260 length:210 start_codon:yes stop_codon:yes gene_type:complete